MINPYGPPTDKQLAFIKLIHETCLGVPPFTGMTKAEACEYISDYVDIFNDHCAYQELVFWGEV